MKTLLSKRERILLLAMAAVVIIYVGLQFFIIPYYNDYTDKQEQYEQLLFDKGAMEAKLGNDAAIRLNNKETENEINELKSVYPTSLTSSEADQIISGLCRKSGLSPVSLGMSDAKNYEAASGKEQNSNGDGEQGAKSARSPAFSVITANMTMSGSYDSLMNLLDMAEELEYIRISKVAYTESRDSGKTGASNISVTFEISMLNEMQ